MPNDRKVLINYLVKTLSKDNEDINKINNTLFWDLEENMHADHFEIHKSAGFRSGHIPLKIIKEKEICEIAKSLTK